jgi:hypothetical protein
MPFAGRQVESNEVHAGFLTVRSTGTASPCNPKGTVLFSGKPKLAHKEWKVWNNFVFAFGGQARAAFGSSEKSPIHS